MNCTPASLAAAAACFRCLGHQTLESAKSYLLCQWANKGTGPVITPLVQDWLDRIADAGGARPADSTIQIILDFETALDACGIKSKMHSLCCFVPDNLTAAITPLISDIGYDANAPLPVWDNQGFVPGDLSVDGLESGGNLKYLNTGAAFDKLPNLPGFGASYFISKLGSGGFPYATWEVIWGSVSKTPGLTNADYSLGGTGAAQFQSTGHGATNVGLITYEDEVGFWSVSRTTANAIYQYRLNSANPFAQVDFDGSADDGVRCSVPVFVNALGEWIAGAPGASGSNHGSAAFGFFALHDSLDATQTECLGNAVVAMRVAFGSIYPPVPPDAWTPNTEIGTWYEGMTGPFTGDAIAFAATANLAAVTELDLSGTAVTSFNYAFFLPNLANLDISNSGLTGVLDLTVATNLYQLSVHDCLGLTDLNVQSAALAYINASNSTALTNTNIGVITAPNVDSLYFDGTNIGSLDVSFCGSLLNLGVTNCANLSQLYVGSTGISTLDLTGDIQLTLLDANNCLSLSSIPSHDAIPLQTVNLNSCILITSLDFSIIGNLNSLDAGFCGLTSLNIANCNNLSSLLIPNNSLNTTALNTIADALATDASVLPTNNGTADIIGNPGLPLDAGPPDGATAWATLSGTYGWALNPP